MKLLHAGLLAVGAALAGGVAVWMTQPPALPPAPATADIAPAPAVVVAAPPPAQYQSPPAPPPEIASPPPVYAEPSHVESAHVEKPSPAPRPKPKTPTPAPAPVTVTAVVPPPRPAPYEEPPARKTPDPPPVVVPAPEPAPAPTRSATLRPGYEIAVRLQQTLSADRAEKGDIFQGVLADPVVADGYVIAERGAPVMGRVVQVQNGTISLRLLNMETADGQRLEVSTEPWPIRVVSGQSVVRFRLSARITITERKL
jgi:hypothetical protein